MLAKHASVDKYVGMLAKHERLVLTDISMQALPDDVYFVVFTAIAVPIAVSSNDNCL